MTAFYILLDGDTEKDVLYETNLLGEESFGKFYPSVGYTAFSSIINNHPEYVDNIEILDDKNFVIAMLQKPSMFDLSSRSKCKKHRTYSCRSTCKH